MVSIYIMLSYIYIYIYNYEVFDLKSIHNDYIFTLNVIECLYGNHHIVQVIAADLLKMA